MIPTYPILPHSLSTPTNTAPRRAARPAGPALVDAVTALAALAGVGLGIWLGWQAHAVRMADDVAAIREALAEQTRADKLSEKWLREAEAEYRKAAACRRNAEQWAAEAKERR